MAVIIGTGSFLLFLSLAVNIMALLVPYWVDGGSFLTLTAGKRTHGLFGTCTCNWFYHDFEDVADSDMAPWYQATQWLYAVAVALLGVALITIFIVSCCSEKSYGKAMTAAGALTLIAAVLIGVAIVVFGVKGHEEYGYGLESTPKLLWGFWVAVTGFGVALITAIVFLVQGHRL